MPEFEQQRGAARFDHRDGTRKVQARLAVDAQLEFLLGVGGTAGERLVDRLEQRRRLAEHGPNRVAEQLPARQLEQVLRGGIGIGDLERLGEQQDRRREQLQPGIGSRVIVASHGGERVGGHAFVRERLPRNLAYCVASSAPMTVRANG